MANMPGKTRHLQTYEIKVKNGNEEEDFVKVCDCPGLVFPSTKKCSRAGLVLAGVLPVHQMRDYIGPVDLLVKKIPYTIFNLLYRLTIVDQAITGRQLLELYSQDRGYHAQGAAG